MRRPLKFLRRGGSLFPVKMKFRSFPPRFSLRRRTDSRFVQVTLDRATKRFGTIRRVVLLAAISIIYPHQALVSGQSGGDTLPANVSLHQADQEMRKVHFASGFKIGEVTADSATLWTQLTRRSEPVPVRHGREEGPYRLPIDFNSSMPVDQMDGAVVPTAGEIRVHLEAEDDRRTLPWQEVDGPITLPLQELSPDTEYTVRIEGRQGPEGPVTETNGSFRTAPAAESASPVRFAAVSDQYFWDYDDARRGFLVYDRMAEAEPDFLVFSGDFIYYDKPGPWTWGRSTAIHKWDAMHAWPALREFYREVPAYFQKDDHDTLRDDADPSAEPLSRFTLEEGIALWYEQTPVTGHPYRTFRWGRDLQIWLLEGREFRSLNDAPDGPSKTILGTGQKEWLVRTLEASDASFKLVFSPSAIVGPDRDNKSDNHSNAAYQTEGDWLRQLLARHDAIVVIGDRHWQYVSEDPETGLIEFNKGPASESHASGWDSDDRRPEHRFLRIGAGYLFGEVDRIDGQPRLRLEIRDTEGRTQYERSF